MMLDKPEVVYMPGAREAKEGVRLRGRWTARGLRIEVRPIVTPTIPGAVSGLLRRLWRLP